MSNLNTGSLVPNPLIAAQSLGQSVWYDNISRGLIKSGELSKLIDLGISGVTSNPTIFERAISDGSDYDYRLGELIKAGRDSASAFETIAIEDIQATADLLRAIYDSTEGVDGYVSLEVPPGLAHNTDATVDSARRLFATLQRPNVMIKVPATNEGIAAIRTIISDGINVNVTLIFSIQVYNLVMNSYIRGLQDRVLRGQDLKDVRSVASFFISRIDTAVDKQLQDRIDKGEEPLKALLGTSAIASARKAFASFQTVFNSPTFDALKVQGARVQRPLWASTSTKNPSYKDTLYVEPLVGNNTVNTMPPLTIEAVLDHGVIRPTLEGTEPLADEALSELHKSGIDMAKITEQLLHDGVSSFQKSYDSVLRSIEAKSLKLVMNNAI